MQDVPPNDGEKPRVHFPPPSGPPPAQYQHAPSHEHYVPPAGPPAAQHQQEPPYEHYAPAAGPPPAQHQPLHDQHIPPAGPGGFPPQPAPPAQHPNQAPIPEYNSDNVQFNVPPAKPDEIELSEEERRHARGKSWSTRMHHLGAKAAAPINALVNKMGSQAFLPSTMDKECEKAAAILLSFCAEGAYGEGHRSTTPPIAAKPGITATTETATAIPNATPNATATASGAAVTRARSRDRALFTIPQKVLSKAVGLAIFTTARVGFEVSLATGSGVLIARLPDGSWGPPSAIQVHTLGAGFLVGLDIYDCVCVINTKEALSAFTRTRVALGTEVSVAAGPFGAGGKVDVGTSAGHPRRQDGPPLIPSEKPTDHAVSAGETYPEQHQAGETYSGQHQKAATAADGTLLPAEPQRPEPQHRRSSSKAMGPVFTYVKSRGFFAGVHVDGTVITERKEANHAFYGERLPAERILRREGVVDQPGAKLWPAGARVLAEALRKAERERPHEEVIVSPAVATPAITQPPPKVEPVSGYGPPAVTQSGPRVDPMDGYTAPMPKVEPVGGQASEGGAVPVYVDAPNDGPPPYADDGTVHPGVGDHKAPPPQ